ncbi:MAG TPA: DUF1559 domain-containing protein, partial [Planctomycetaceae bacterium]|nr:DUF1559 domain-containing protein [Planctomycetaceae bacterium]
QFSFKIANCLVNPYSLPVEDDPAAVQAINGPLIRTRLDVLECPSHPHSGQRSTYAPNNPEHWYSRNNQPRTSYLVCVGYFTDYSADYNVYRGNSNRYRTGVFGNNGAARLADITDGTSNVTLVGEAWGGDGYKCSRHYGPWGLAGIHTSVHGRVVSGWAVSRYSRAQWANWGRDWHINAAFRIWNPNYWCARAQRARGVRLAYAWAFNSGHPGGAQFAFADGSVEFLTETMDYKTFCLLNYISDAQVASRK